MISSSDARASWVCVTPVRNEGWILEQFLSAAGSWADRIIIADQASTDRTRDIALQYPKVELLANESTEYDERHRQKLLLDQARQVPGKKILIALDADEALSADCSNSSDWDKIASAAPGTVLRFRWVNVLPGFQHAWIPPDPVAFGYVDDGCNHTTISRIHNPRLPQPEGAPILDLKEIVVLHFQYAVWDRMKSKQRWYQTWEYLNNSGTGPLDIFRRYNHMFGGWPSSEIHSILPQWLRGYDRAGNDFRSLVCEDITWWDKEVFALLAEHGVDHFSKLAIWDRNWSTLAESIGIPSRCYHDPRSRTERLIHTLLRITQNRRSRWDVRIFERLLRASGW